MSIEKEGKDFLKEYLSKNGRKVQKSDRKTFDFVVDGRYAEVKTSKKSFARLGFIHFTDKQFEEIKPTDFLIFLVCNVGGNEQIYEFSSSSLRNLDAKRYSSYEYNQSLLNSLNLKPLL